MYMEGAYQNDGDEKNSLGCFGEQARVFYYPVSCGALGWTLLDLEREDLDAEMVREG